MANVQGAIHVFTDSPQTTVKYFIRNFEKRERERLERQKITHDDVIEYPHAVSCFCDLNLSYDYLAADYSKIRKAPVLVSIVGVRNPVPREHQALMMYWGFGGKCISKSLFLDEINNVSRESTGIEEVAKRLGLRITNEHLWKTKWEGMKPLEIVQSLENELGIYLGGRDVVGDFIQRECELKNKLLFGSIYKVDHRFVREPYSI